MIFQNNNQDYPPEDNDKYSECPSCGGTGLTEDEDACPECDGTGYNEDDNEPDWDNIRDERNENNSTDES